MDNDIKWAAQLNGVRELSLLGTADADFWRHRLKSANLAPLELDGRAQLLLIAAQLRFAGVRFHELSFSVLVAPTSSGAAQPGSYLLRAYNSNRFFAWCERAFFSTPYYPADVRVDARYPGSIDLSIAGRPVLAAKMMPDPTETERGPLRTGDDGWEGRVYLPGETRAADGAKYFHAKLRGQTRTYAFLPGGDKCELNPEPQDDELRAFLASGFAPREWSLREDAFHAKSKTYPRG